MVNEALKVLHDFNEVCDLGDLIYHVRECEGLGWDGPKVQAWADAHERMQKLLENYEDHQKA